MQSDNLKIEKILTKYFTNTYFVFTDTDAVVIDPGGNIERILEFLKENGDKPVTVLITHGHFDHILSAAELVKNGGKAYMSLNDDFLIADGGHMLSRGVFVEKFEYTDIRDGDVLDIGGASFKVLATPGHSPGSVCFCLNDYIFSGDTLFYGSVGRTDLFGGSSEALAASLKKFISLDKDYIILPGHGQQTTLENEKSKNQFLKNL